VVGCGQGPMVLAPRWASVGWRRGARGLVAAVVLAWRRGVRTEAQAATRHTRHQSCLLRPITQPLKTLICRAGMELDVAAVSADPTHLRDDRYYNSCLAPVSLQTSSPSR